MKKVNAYAIPGIPQSLENVALYINAETPEEIIYRVAYEWETSYNEITGLSRKGEIPIARHVAAYMIRSKFRLSTYETGKILGGKNYATILHSCKTVESLWVTDKRFRKKMINLI